MAPLIRANIFQLPRADLDSRDDGGGGELGLIFAGYVPLSSQGPYPSIVYSMTSYRPYLSHFWAKVIFVIPT